MSGSMPEPEVVTASTGMSPDRQTRVVRALELQDRCGLRLHVLGEIRVRRAEVREGRRARVVRRSRRGRARVEVLGLRECLRGQPRADDLAVRPR